MSISGNGHTFLSVPVFLFFLAFGYLCLFVPGVVWINYIFITFIAPLFYFLALKELDLGVAFAFSSLNYALVMIASILLLKEKISLSKIIGTSIIVIGKLLFNIKFK